MPYRLWALVALLALILGLVVLSGPPSGRGAAAAPEGPLHDPGYSAVQARLVQTGADGRPLYTLEAAQMQQQPNGGRVDLQQVQLGYRDTNDNQWTARATHGELAPGSSVVQLDGDVHVDGTLPGSADAVQIVTEHLSFDTNAQIVMTHDPLTLVTAGRELHAIGMSASLKERQVQLESAVHGVFQQ
jgi:LPS export ABC transporter protein LptC